MDPVDSAWHVRIFYAVAGIGIILHDLSCAALSFFVYLQKYDCLVWGRGKAVVCYDAVYC